MYNNYISCASPMHRLNSTIKVINFLIFFLALFFGSSKELLIALSIISILFMVNSNISINLYSKKLGYLIIPSLIIIYIMYSFNASFYLIFSVVLKLILLSIYYHMVIFTTKPFSIGASLAIILNIFNFLSININKLTIIFTNIVLYIPNYISERNKYLDTLALKGIDYKNLVIIEKIKLSFSNFFVINKKIIANNKLRNKEIDYKLYNITNKKINKSKSKVKIIDIFYLIIHLLLVVYYILRIRGVA